ncbi:MAG: amidohydrolase family protein [Betaproteobacteria bacterium]|nr:amidohydrolase family protein [Betaproteobacteria bacterium]
MIDTLIRGDCVATLHGLGAWDVAIEGERIAAVAAAGTFADRDAGRVIDARGRIVIPGGIDPHIHCKFPQPMGTTSAPPVHVSRAALFGGTTTMLDFAVWDRGETLQQTLEKREEDCWRGQCYCDYGFHVLLSGKMPLEIFDQIPEVIQAGFPSIKMFMTEVRPERSNWKLDLGDIWEVLQVLGKHEGIACIHAEDNDLVMHMYEKMFREDRVAFQHMAEVHSSLSEDISYRRIIRLAENVDRAAVYLMHTSARTGVDAIAESRARGFPIYGETLHQYALFTSEDYLRPNGQIYHTYPSLKMKRDHKALWDGMHSGTISCIATDGICTPLAIKTSGERIDNTVGGNVGVEPRLSVMYTETVVNRGWPIPLFVDLVAANAARIFGFYPRKGVIAPGSDADIVILDPALRRRLRKEDLHEADYSPWEGYEVAAWPQMTLLRGKAVVEGTSFLGDPRDGHLLKRKLAEPILNGPACARA